MNVMKTLRIRQRYMGKKQNRDPETGICLNGQVQPAWCGALEPVSLSPQSGRVLTEQQAENALGLGSTRCTQHASVETREEAERTEYYFQCGAGYKT